MDREIKLTRDAAEGDRAFDLLNNETFKAVVRKFESDCFDAWLSSRPSDTDAREKLYHRVNAMRTIGQDLQTMINNGKIATAELNTKKTA